MKRSLVKTLPALLGVVTLSLWAGSANAVVCPPPQSPDTTFTLTVTGGTATIESPCYDYGTAANPENNGDLVLPSGEFFLFDKIDADSPGNGTLVPLTGDLDDGFSGTFYINETLDDLILLFKTGGGQNNPSWFAFRVFNVTPEAVFSWNITGTSPNNALSHTSLYAVPVPAAVWLFGSGLIGLIGIGRRRRSAVPA